jgi:protocatechuate 3,4-dioxygenase beta subunit
MKAKKEQNRRNFLKTISIGTFSLAAFPMLIKKANATSNIQLNTISGGACNTVTLDYYGQGPFYTPNAPVIDNHIMVDENEPGTRLIISGVIKTLDCSQIIPNATIDIWQANAAGDYDNTGFNLRGVTYSNAQGFYYFETVLPGKYLNGSKYRPRHIHVKITPPNFPAIITQLYFEGDTDIPGDAAASQNSGTYDASNRILPLSMNGEGKYETTWDIVVDGDGINGIENARADKGMIYNISPNPFTDELTINYGIFSSAKVSIEVFDTQGKLVDVLDENYYEANKRTLSWQPNSNINKGVYWVSLKINDMQVHYQKVVKL